MEYKVHENSICLETDSGEVLATVEFPAISEDGKVVDVCHTFVSDSLRGQGIANILMEKLVSELRRTGRKARLTCSYAVKWFSKHSENGDLIDA